MESSLTKQIALNHRQLSLAHAVIRVNEIQQPALDELHKSLAMKIERARFVCTARTSVEMSFSDQERMLMRHYNTNYCAILANNLIENMPTNAICGPDYAEIYQVVTSLQLLFSSLK